MRECDREFIQLTKEANEKGLATYELLEARTLSDLSVNDFTKTIILRQKIQQFVKEVEDQQ